MFRHHPDGHIHINGFVLPLSEFLLEEPNYALPEGATGREYDPVSGTHFLFDGRNQWEGPVPWTEGDNYLALENMYRTNRENRRPPPPPPPLPAEQVRRQLQDDPTLRAVARVLARIDGKTAEQIMQEIVDKAS